MTLGRYDARTLGGIVALGSVLFLATACKGKEADAAAKAAGTADSSGGSTLALPVVGQEVRKGDLNKRALKNDAVNRLKAIKSATEKQLIRETAKLQDQVFQRLLLKIQPGMRDSEISAIAQFEGQLLGSEQGIFLGGSARIGRTSFFAQRHFQGRTFGKGDYFPLLVENNGVGGYYCELARTIVLGKATQELIEANATMREAQEHTVRKLRPGASCKEIFQAHNEFMGRKGLPLETRLYSHSQGYDLVERPIVRSDETMPLDEGMNMAVHPAFATSSTFSVICDNYLIERDGPSECLHGTPKEIFEVN